MKINTVAGSSAGQELNRVHIAAMNVNKQLVYITGIVNPSAGTGNTQQDENSADNVLTNVQVQVVDSVGAVGKWCALSLDADGNPWIAYMDESKTGTRSGAKAAIRNTSWYYKGLNGYDGSSEYTDMYGTSLVGWEVMHVPAMFNVENPVRDGRENGRLGLECFPTRNVTPTTNNRIWSAALGFLSYDSGGGQSVMDKHRLVYYVK
jgi:hypothetical protein